MQTTITHYRPWSLLNEFRRELEERVAPGPAGSLDEQCWPPPGAATARGRELHPSPPVLYR